MINQRADNSKKNMTNLKKLFASLWDTFGKRDPITMALSKIQIFISEFRWSIFFIFF